MRDILKIIGGVSVGIVILAIANAPDKPKRQLTDDEVKAGITRSYCRELVMDSLRTTDGASIPITRNYPQSMDGAGVVWLYNDTVKAQNNLGMMTETPFECHVSFAMGTERATFLQIGNDVLIGGK